MKKTPTPRTFNEYVQYWEKWHKQWWAYKSGSFMEWPKPNGNGGHIDLLRPHSSPIIDFYPEPYYYRFSNNIPNTIDAIFININPAAGGPTQFKLNSTSPLISSYCANGNSYQKSLTDLLNLKGGPNSFLNHREKRTRELLAKNSADNVQVLCVDLVPWHTANQADIHQYIIDNSSLIMDYVIKPLTRISKKEVSGPLAKKILIRGTSFRNVINAIGPNIFPKSRLDKAKSQIKYYGLFDKDKVFIERFSSLLTVVEAFDCKYFIFTGGQGMTLPPINKKALLLNSTDKSRTLLDIILE